jgi:hypothetical protein
MQRVMHNLASMWSKGISYNHFINTIMNFPFHTSSLILSALLSLSEKAYGLW